MRNHSRFALAYSRLIVRRPLAVLLTLAILGAAATWGTAHLTVNSNQLDLISQDLREVKDLKRVIDMVGGAGFLMLALRSADEKQLKSVSDDLSALLLKDTENVRSVTYKVPVEFVQQNMVLFIKNADLAEAKTRINAYLKDQLRRNNPFFIEIQKTEPVKLNLQDLVDKYNHVGKKSIQDDFYISDDKKMLLLLIKPMWDTNQIGKTNVFIEKLNRDLKAYSGNNSRGVKLVEDYDLMGDNHTIAYGYSGTYKSTVDDSFAITHSLEPVSIFAFLGILIITFVFFRKPFPTVIVITGMVLGTLLTMGFTYLTVGSLNMVTSILGGILMGFGVDYGIHFIFRTRIELGAGKPYDVAIQDAILNAGRPATVAAIVTAGSFFVLMVSQFKGFSQFGFLAGCGTPIIGFTMFSWSPALLALIGKRWPHLPAKLIGTMKPPQSMSEGHEISIPRPRLLLGISVAVVMIVCAFAIPWSPQTLPKGIKPTLFQRLRSGVRFDYNTRALMPDDQPSIKLQDEIARRFNISADPSAVFTPTLQEAREVYDELTQHPEKYPTIDQVVSIFSFVPPKENAAANVVVLQQWEEDLKEINVESLPPELQDKATFFKKVLHARPFDVSGVPDVYAQQFRNLPTTRPENQGYLTYIYPGVDLWNGKNMLAFADTIDTITTASGKQFHGAGLPILYAKLARIVLFDGKVTVLLATLWILLMHFLDFRSVKLALASVIPLGVGLIMMLGFMSMLNHRLNFMNIIILPILLGFGVSHGLYLLHRFLEGTSPVVALRSVGAAVASSTLTAIAGFGSLLVASHNGLKSMGFIACLGLATTLVVSFTVLAAVLQLMHEQRTHHSDVSAEPAPRATG